MMTQALAILVIVIAFLLSSTDGSAQGFITAAEFKSLISVSAEIDKLCPSPECLVIGLGRSPTPILAFLQAQKPDHARQLPLSAFKYGTSEMGVLTSDQEVQLFEHFDHYLAPLKTRTGPSKVLLVDYGNSGDSLVAAQSYLNKYLVKNQLTTQSRYSRNHLLAPKDQCWNPC